MAEVIEEKKNEPLEVTTPAQEQTEEEEEDYLLEFVN